MTHFRLSFPKPEPASKPKLDRASSRVASRCEEVEIVELAETKPAYRSEEDLICLSDSSFSGDRSQDSCDSARECSGHTSVRLGSSKSRDGRLRSSSPERKSSKCRRLSPPPSSSSSSSSRPSTPPGSLSSRLSGSTSGSSFASVAHQSASSRSSEGSRSRVFAGKSPGASVGNCGSWASKGRRWSRAESRWNMNRI